MDRYCITVNWQQLMLIARVLEDISRFAAGDTLMYNTVSDLTRDTPGSDMFKQIEKHLLGVKEVLYPTLPDGSNYGYNGNEEEQTKSQKDMTGNTYQIYREIYHFAAKELDINSVYRSETMPSGTFGGITVKKIKSNG